MFYRFLNWRTALSVIAIVIVTGTVFYSQYLANKIAADERQKVETWVEAEKFLISSPPDTDTRLVSAIIINNNDIPIIGVNEAGGIIHYINLDSAKVNRDSGYLHQKIRQFKSQHEPIVYTDPLNGKKDLYYYGSSALLQEVKYYPLVQLLIVALFIFFALYAIATRNRSVQNQLWAGMAKETAHQLGTPVTSLQGWVAMLKEDPYNEKMAAELAKDVDRLQLVSDRFSKIGSTPKLEEKDLLAQVGNMVDYIRRRSPEKVQFIINAGNAQTIPVKISASLFDWVIENLLKNALDAMGGKGVITIDITQTSEQVQIDVNDTGRGINSANINSVFKPGFTTKKRGWGLGLTLSRRIIQQYHTGQLFVKSSEAGKGTTFRIILQKSAG
ncbi:HAMP domain-containing sensor histidine kinase [Agriterribacter sp.]|uniref:sensor histidine kinase n=1 Tax=Agriterribacter sp. TaxID=2821509 RepID=UPI002CB4EEFD|nr:HAMP domain-containing sensor histidine kinase [Agriterribacter sp.]HTN05716.1 HAMP domain-containing sensor histidine kinase [Agriterribacter sp.]